MDSKNLLHIGNFQEFQPFIIVDDWAFPIGYDTRSCTAGAADIIRGKTAATSSGVVEGVLDAGNNYFVCTSVVSDKIGRAHV